MIYKDHGFNSRKEYLIDLAEQYGVDPEYVFQLANILGESEDFDGLITAVQDMESYDEEWGDE